MLLSVADDAPFFFLCEIRLGKSYLIAVLSITCVIPFMSLLFADFIDADRIIHCLSVKIFLFACPSLPHSSVVVLFLVMSP